MSVEDILHPLLSAYIASPQWVKSSIGRCYSMLPVGFRHGLGYTHYRDELIDKSLPSVQALSRRKLAQSLRWAIETVPAYHQWSRLLPEIESSPELVLQQLPPVGKEEFKHNLDAYLSTEMPEKKRLRTFTGGSTANPMQFYLEKNVSRPKEYAFMEDFHARVGLKEESIVLALRGRTVPTAAKANGRLWMFEPIKRQLILSSDHLESRYMPEYVAALLEWKPDYIQAFPSALYPLARWLQKHPLPEVTEAIRGILLYSENVFDDQMALLREVFDCPVLKHYGHSERVLMAASMPDDDRYFFWPQYGYFELLDEKGNLIKQPGVLGEIVGTGFDNRVMSFIRYRTGDMAMLSEKPHPLLPGYPVVERIEGRLQEFIVCRDHRLISICTMGAAHFNELASVEAIQYEQNVPGHFVLKVVTTSPLSDTVKTRIQQAVEEKTQGGCTAEVVEVAEIPRTARGKHRMLIQHLDIGSYLGGGGKG